MEYSEEVRCPKCNSNQLTSNQKGFSAGKAIGGAFLTGGVGLLAGFIGSKKVLITCLKCGKNFNAGEGKIVRVPISINYSSENHSSEKTKAIEDREVVKKIIVRNNSSVLTPEEEEIYRKRILEKKIIQKNNKKEARKDAVIYSFTILAIASYPMIYLFKEALNSDFGFFFFMLFMFGLIFTGFIFKLIWDSAK